MKNIAIALMVFAVCGTPAFAGEMKKDGGAMLGYAVPMGDAGDLLDSSMAFGFDYEGYKVNEQITIGGSFLYTSANMKDDAYGGLYGDASDVSWSTWGLTPYVKAAKQLDLGGKKATIYGQFGLGLYGSSMELAGFDASSTDLGINLGGGIMFPLADKMSLGFDLKYHNIMASGSTWTYLVPGVRFAYNF